MTRSNITSPKGPAEWGSKARKADAKARKGNLRRIALRDAVRNG